MQRDAQGSPGSSGREELRDVLSLTGGGEEGTGSLNSWLRLGGDSPGESKDRVAGQCSLAASPSPSPWV